MLALPTRTLGSFHSDIDARTVDFFDAFANELPDDMGAQFKAYGAQFIRKHARVQLKSLFKLNTLQCNQVIVDVNAALCHEEEAGYEDGIRESIEEAAGLEFQKPKAPESAALVPTKKNFKRELEDDENDALKGRSISQKVSREKQLEAMLPNYIFDGVTTPDPLNNAISESELSGILDEILKFISKTFGASNLGIAMARIYAAQIRAKVKIGDRGKKNRVLGKDRDLAGSLVEKSRNRTYKPVSARDRTLGHCPCLAPALHCIWP